MLRFENTNQIQTQLVFFSLVFSGPVSSMLVKRFGSRPVVMMGGLMCGVSMVTASFGSSIVYLYLCIGIIGGRVQFFGCRSLINYFVFTCVFSKLMLSDKF